MTNPVTFVGDEAIIGFNPKAIAKALSVQVSSVQRQLDKLSDKETLTRLGIMVDALAKLVGSIPKDVLLKDFDGRTAPLMVSPRSELHYQQFCLDARKTGQWLADELFVDLPKKEVDWIDSSNPEELADYGNRVANGYKEWSNNISQQDMDQPIKGYYGDTTMSALLNIALGHIAFHIKTHYKDARKFAGIEPPVALKDELFEGIPSLIGKPGQ